MANSVKEIVISPSQKALLLEWLLVLVPVSLVYLILIFGLASLIYNTFGLSIFLLFLIISVALFLGFWLNFKTSYKNLAKSTKYVISNEKIDVLETGFSSKYYSYNMRGYTSMKLDHPAFTRFINCGRITLYFMGGSSVEIRNIENPELVMSEIEVVLSSK